jgi:hypothetical protein
MALPSISVRLLLKAQSTFPNSFEEGRLLVKKFSNRPGWAKLSPNKRQFVISFEAALHISNSK